MGGHSVTPITPRKAQVSFAGNGFTATQQAETYGMLRACEYAMESGYPYFVVLDSQTEEVVSSYQATPDRIEVRPDGYGGSVATLREGNVNTRIHPGATFTVYLLTQQEAQDLLSQVGDRLIWAPFYFASNAPDRALHQRQSLVQAFVGTRINGL